jgi:hypothetical protein
MLTGRCHCESDVRVSGTLRRDYEQVCDHVNLDEFPLLVGVDVGAVVCVYAHRLVYEIASYSCVLGWRRISRCTGKLIFSSVGVSQRLLSVWFRDTALILFLNKIDLFESKLREYDMSKWFPDYSGGDDFEQGQLYWKKVFEGLVGWWAWFDLIV